MKIELDKKYSAEEAGEYFGVSDRTIRRWSEPTARIVLRAYKPGKIYYIYGRDILDFEKRAERGQKATGT